MNFKRSDISFAPLSRPQDIFHADYLGRYADDRYKMGAVRTRAAFYIRAYNRMLDNADNKAEMSAKISRVFALRGGLIGNALAQENPHGAFDLLLRRLDVAKSRKNVRVLVA